MPEKPRLPRIERSEPDHLEDETAHLWAVSYSDFLMVLLSFFILFFSVDKDKKESVIQRIISSTEAGEEGAGATGRSSSPTDSSHFSKTAIQSALDGLRVKTLDDKKSLLLLFPDNLFAPTSFRLTGKKLTSFENVLWKLKPYSAEIEITIVGHSDKKALRKPSGLIENNFDLSVMRAAKALQHALGIGMNPEILSAKGAGVNDRDTRSISLLIKPRSK